MARLVQISIESVYVWVWPHCCKSINWSPLLVEPKARDEYISIPVSNDKGSPNQRDLV